jgi:uroporphyrinogen decarboxylase
MNSKERFLAAVSHNPPDRIPIDLRFAPELEARLKRDLKMEHEEFWDWLGQDVYTVRPTYPHPASPIKYADPTVRVEDDMYFDIYQVPFRMMKLKNQTYLEPAGIMPPLEHVETVEELSEFPWPSTDSWDYSGIPEGLAARPDKALWCRSRGCFQTAMFMRGTEQFLEDLVLNEELADELLDKIFTFTTNDIEKSLIAGGGYYTFVEYNDDVATQRDLMISPQMWRRYLKPRMQHFCEMAHSYGALVRYHSCGSIYRIIEDLIEIGVDILNPIQPQAANMDPYRIKKEFGDRICLHGAIDIQQLLPYGTAEQVRSEVERLVTELGKDGGYILAGSHTIQADTPTANIVAIVEAIKGVYNIEEL